MATQNKNFIVKNGIDAASTVTADQFAATNNGNGTNYKVGDDAWLGDINLANTVGLKGIQSATVGYLKFGGDTNTFGYNGTNLVYGTTVIPSAATLLTSASPTFTGTITGPIFVATGGDGTNSSIQATGYNQRGGVGYHGFLQVTNTYGSATNPSKHFRINSTGALEIVNSSYSATIFSLTDAGVLTANSFVKSGGTSAQYLMADGSVSSGTSGPLTQTALSTGFSIAGGTTSKTLTVSNTITLAGTDSTTMTFPAISGTVATLNTANTFTTAQTITPGTSVTALSINGATSSTGLSITAAATPGTFIDYRDNNNVSVGSVGSDGTNYIKIIKNVGGTANRAVFSDLSSSVIVYAANTNYVGLSVRRFSDSQTSDLQQWTNSNASAVYAKIDKDGNLTASSIIKTGGTSSQYLMADGSTTNLTANTDIIPLDDISNQFDGSNYRFIPTYQGSQVTISNPFRLLLTINGIMQYIDSPEYVWMSGIPRRGFFVDSGGQLQFSEAVPPGSEFDARLMPGDITTTRTRTYPFKALDILLGG